MKHLALIVAVLASLLASTSLPALPIHWDVDLAAQPPQVFSLQRPRGETYALEAVLKDHGKPFAPAITNACIYWQTNGMETLYWSAPASVSNNVLRASWLPSMDPGATTVRGYIGDPGHIYAAAFQFRFISSPGATPNELPLPQKVIDFAKVTVLNPPWSGGGGGGVDTNAVLDLIHKTVDGSARPLPPYLHYLEMDDTYPDAAAEWYAQADYSHGSCSAVRDGNMLSRNYDWKFDFMPEFVVRVPAASERFASIAVCNVGTNLTEADVVSGKHLRWYKALPGHAVDGINEHGVCAEVNVVGGDPHGSGWPTNGTIHCLGAVRWVLDHATNAASAASVLASEVYFPSGWQQNFHWMIADETSTYIVENGVAHNVGGDAVMTNFSLYPTYDDGMGWERFTLLALGASITNVWYTNAYRRETNPPWMSDLKDVLAYTNDIFNAWASHPKEYFRNKTNGGQPWWQTVHTSVYDITNRVLRVAVQEVDDWYTFQVPVTAPKIDAYTKAEADGLLDDKADKTNTYTKAEADELLDGKADSTNTYTKAEVDGLIDEAGKVKSVNGKDGEVILTAEDVHALPDTYTPPEAPVTSVNEKTGHVILSANDVGAIARPIRVTIGNLASFDRSGNVIDSGTDVSSFVPKTRKINGQPLTSDITIEGMTDNAAVLTNGALKTKSGTAITAGHVGAASADQLEPLSLDITRAYQYSQTVSLYMTGNTNAWFAGTNYVFGADAASRAHFSWEQGMDAATVPCSMALWEIRDGVRQCVWDQRDWPSWYWSFKANQMRGEIAASNELYYAYVNGLVTNDQNHAWAKRYASTGRRNPDASTTFIDTPSVTLSPGMSWETVATVGGCGYWTIVGNGAVIGGSGTNATLNIKDFEGNSILEITKGQHMLAWLESSDFVGHLTDDQHWVCFDMMADVKPTGYFSTTLVAADFVAETDANCPAQYSWEDLGGHVWRVHFLLKPGIVSDACFAKFQVEVEGKTQIRYNADTVINGGLIFDGVKIAPVIQSGASVGSTVTWKVVQ